MRRLVPFAENFAEATTACLITMVQGNVLILGVGHWLIASRTGFFAGSIAAVVYAVARGVDRWAMAGILTVATSIVDYLVHPGAFGPVFLEAVVTGLAAGALSLLVGAIRRRRRPSD